MLTTRAAAVSPVDRALSALADPVRRGVVEMLRKRPRRAGELAAAFDVSAPAMSRHLRVLRKNGLVEGGPVEQDARVRLYRLRREPFAALQAWLRAMDAFWAGQLDSFKAHAERARKGKRS